MGNSPASPQPEQPHRPRRAESWTQAQSQERTRWGGADPGADVPGWASAVSRDLRATGPAALPARWGQEAGEAMHVRSACAWVCLLLRSGRPSFYGGTTIRAVSDSWGSGRHGQVHGEQNVDLPSGEHDICPWLYQGCYFSAEGDLSSSEAVTVLGGAVLSLGPSSWKLKTPGLSGPAPRLGVPAAHQATWRHLRGSHCLPTWTLRAHGSLPFPVEGLAPRTHAPMGLRLLPPPLMET